jgi:hypothetical protein
LEQAALSLHTTALNDAAMKMAFWSVELLYSR